MAGQNIHFLGAVDNDKLAEVYRANDVFVLPSIKEPWGLVVEEAFNNGLPVILSDRIGCAESLLVKGKNGYMFEYDNKPQLESVIKTMCNIETYNFMRKNVCDMNFEEYARKQTECYFQ